MIVRRHHIALVLLLIVCAGGCGRQQVYPTYMDPELLYLKDQPYTKLYVEVDTVEGAEVPPEWLDQLEAFLAAHCRKPGGITISRDEPIPLSEVQDLTITEAALLHTDGPPMDDGEQPAYLHVFFYDLAGGLSGMSRRPHVLPYCPTTIFYNVGHLRHLAKCVHIDWFRHEAGHILGLCRNQSHGDGVHCRSYDCLMRRSSEELSSLARMLGTPVGFEFDPRPPCKRCLRDLAALRARDVNESLSFAGPFLVRHEDGYLVARLPQCDLVGAFLEGTFNWRKTLESTKNRVMKSIAQRREGREVPVGDDKGSGAGVRQRKAPKKGRGLFVFSVLAPSDPGSPPPTAAQLAAILTQAGDDRCPVIRGLTRHTLERMKNRSASEDPAPATPQAR